MAPGLIGPTQSVVLYDSGEELGDKDISSWQTAEKKKPIVYEPGRTAVEFYDTTIDEHGDLRPSFPNPLSSLSHS